MRKSDLQKIIDDNGRIMIEQRERINALVEENGSLRKRAEIVECKDAAMAEPTERLAEVKRALLSCLVALDNACPKLRDFHAVEEDYYLEYARLAGTSCASTWNDGRMSDEDLDDLIKKLGGIEE